jgi:hypothetical protein
MLNLCRATSGDFEPSHWITVAGLLVMGGGVRILRTMCESGGAASPPNEQQRFDGCVSLFQRKSVALCAVSRAPHV